MFAPGKKERGESNGNANAIGERSSATEKMHRGRPETLNIKSNLRRDNNNDDASGKSVHSSTQKTDTMLAEELRTILITQAREIED